MGGSKGTGELLVVCFLHVGDMSLSPGGGLRASPRFGADPSAAAAPCHTVLMSVPVSVCHSGMRPLRLPGPGDGSLRLQLSMDPGKSGDFRLSIQSSCEAGRTVVSPIMGAGGGEGGVKVCES